MENDKSLSYVRHYGSYYTEMYVFDKLDSKRSWIHTWQYNPEYNECTITVREYYDGKEINFNKDLEIEQAKTMIEKLNKWVEDKK